MKMKRFFALIIALTMCISVFPSRIFAANPNDATFTALDGTANNKAGENYEKLLDDNIYRKWCDKIGLINGQIYTPYIIFKASKQVIITDYFFVTGNDNATHPGRNPKDWVLYGCNDYDEASKTGGSWAAIHTVTNDTVMQDKNYASYHFTIENNNEMYQYYKLEITANHGSAENLMQLSEMHINWTVSYYVTFDKNGGDTEASPKTIKPGKGFPTTDPTKRDYKFVGWYTKDGTNGDWGEEFTYNTIVNEAITVYAKWEKVYQVTFDLNGGEADPINPIYHGDPIPTDVYAKGDMKFVGWFTKNGENGDWGEEYTIDTVVDEDITVYAKWDSISITFDENGGDTPAKRYYADDKDIYAYPCVNPTRTGYYFDGWWTKDGTNGDWGEKYTTVDFDNRTEKKTVYAKWSQKIVPTADMFDFALHNEDTTAVANRVTVTPKEEYENIFLVKKVKFKYYDNNSEQHIVETLPMSNSTIYGTNYTIMADIESLSDDYASAEGLEIETVASEGGYLYINEQDTDDRLMVSERWNYEGGVLNIRMPGFTETGFVLNDEGGNEYTDKISINKRSDGVYEITWGEADLPANEYTLTYFDSNWNTQTKKLLVCKCPVYPVVGNTEQKYNPSGNAITIASNGTKCLDNSKLKVDYYPVDEESGTLSSLTPVSQVTKPGKYMYVISVDDSAADNYEILFRYVPKGTGIPDFRAFDNVGFFTVTQKEADITPQTNAAHTYDGMAYDVSGLFTVDPLAGDKAYSMVKDSETTGEGTLSGNMLTVTKAGTFKIKLNTAETDECLSGEATAFLTVKKGTPGTVVYPTAGDVTYGDTLAQSTLTGGSTNGSFKWKNESTRPTVNNSGYEVVFTPSDGDLYDYNGVNLTDTVSVNVNPLKVIIEWLGTDGLVYDEGTKTVSARVANAVSGETPNLTLGGDYSAIQVGDYTATVTGVDNPNYTISGGQNLEKVWSISKATNSFTTALSIENWTYGDTPNTPQGAAKFGDVVFTYSDSENGTYTSTPSTNAGTYWIKADVAGTENYTALEAKKQFSILPKAVTTRISSIPDKTYTGSDIEPAITVYDGATLIPASEYTVSYTNNRNVGTATVTLTDVAGGNYTVSGSTTFEIKPKTVTSTISAIPDKTYTGSDIKPAITVYDGTTEIPASEYTVSYTNNRNAGTATVTLTDVAGGNYTVSGSTTFEIKPKTVTATISAIPDKTYTGSDIEPAVTVYDGTTEIPASEYTVSYTNNRNAGTATVTLTDVAGGNYTVSGSTTFEIKPKSIEDALITLSGKLTYNGTEQTQKVTVSLAGFDTVTFDVSGNKQTDVKASGNYTLTVTGNGNFAGTKTLDWNIAPATPTENSAKKTTAKVLKNSALAGASVTKGEILALDGKTPLAGTFAWVDGTKIMSAHGTEQMIFTPENTNYAPITIDVAVIVYSSAPIRYIVKFDTNGGNSIVNQTVLKNGKVTKPANPTRDGYIFGGWYTDKELTEKYDFAKAVTKNITLYAKWVREEWKNPFSDVNKGDWFYEDVAYVYTQGLMGFTSMNLFSPNKTTTRGMVVTILYRLDGSPAVSGSCPFADVPSGAYYRDAAIWAVENGITKGYGNDLFKPNDSITREQLATFLYRYAKYKGIDVSVGEDTDILSYKDAQSISEYAFPAMQWLCDKGIMQGSNGNLKPAGNGTRAQIAALLHRFCEKILNG